MAGPNSACARASRRRTPRSPAGWPGSPLPRSAQPGHRGGCRRSVARSRSRPCPASSCRSGRTAARGPGPRRSPAHPSWRFRPSESPGSRPPRRVRHRGRPPGHRRPGPRPGPGRASPCDDRTRLGPAARHPIGVNRRRRTGSWPHSKRQAHQVVPPAPHWDAPAVAQALTAPAADPDSAFSEAVLPAPASLPPPLQPGLVPRPRLVRRLSKRGTSRSSCSSPRPDTARQPCSASGRPATGARSHG